MSFRRAARTDANQTEIVDGLRDFGASVFITSQLKKFADILVGYKGLNYLMEIKDGKKPPSARKLTPDEEEFHDNWLGQIAIVESLEDAIKVIRGQQ